MSLRLRVALLAAGAVALAVIAVATVTFFSTSRALRSEVDDFLHDRAALVDRTTDRFEGRGRFTEGRGPRRVPDPGQGLLGPVLPIGADSVVQVIAADGTVFAIADESVRIPVEDRHVAVAAGQSAGYLSDASWDDHHYRVITVKGPGDTAVQIGRDLGEVDDITRSVGLWSLGIGGLGVLLAALVGWVVARGSLVPVRALDAAATHVAETRDLSARIEVERSDEIGRLATRFNTMMDALQDSRRRQHQLVMDAGHELRTPLTSLRTNLELLDRARDLAGDERRRLMEDVHFELAELSTLVAEVIDLATETPRPGRIERVDLVALTERVADRAARRTGYAIEVVGTEHAVMGDPEQLDRAIGDLVDNAIKFSPVGSPINVTIDGPRVTVRDQGPGISPADQAFVFDRFYRATTARSTPGSGLGLAIAKQIAETHAGAVGVDSSPDGGSEVWIEVPGFSSTS